MTRGLHHALRRLSRSIDINLWLNLQEDPMPEIVVRIRKKADNTLELTPVNAAAEQQIRDRRLSIIRNGKPKKRKFLQDAFNHAKQEPEHQGHAEPLLVLSRDQGDALIWEVVDDMNNRVKDFQVEVHVFDDTSVVVTPAGVPNVFSAFKNGIPVPCDTSGFVHSGLPEPGAVNNDFGWHKFQVTVPGCPPLDPCIFV